MRVLMRVEMPHEPFNALVRAGTAGQKIEQILGELKPEVAYFTEQDGRRGAVLVVNLDDPSRVPTLAEPFFLAFNADVHLQVCMTPEELARAGLEELGKRWG